MEKLLYSKEFLWENLQKETRPILLYGMGDGAEKILNICEQRNIKISGIFASDEFVRGQSFKDWKVKKLEEVESEFSDFVVLQAFGSALPEVLSNIYSINAKHTLYIPDMPMNGTEIFDRDFLNRNIDDIIKVYHMLEDTKSKQTYTEVLLYKITGNLKYLLGHTVSREEMFNELFDFTKFEFYIDAGAYRGDTVQEFLELTDNTYKRIVAFEPNERNFKRMERNLEDVENLQLYNMGVWDSQEEIYFPSRAGRGSKFEQGVPNTLVDSVDNMLRDVLLMPTYIKYDVEGAEKRALDGSINTIQRYKPKLLVSIYHRTDDIFSIPLQLKEMVPEYKFYIRRNPGVPAWDINLIALEQE